MKILQVISSMDARGGGPIEGLIQQGEQLAALGHTVETASLDAPGVPLEPRLQGRCVHLLGPSKGGYAYAPGLAPWLRQHGPTFDCIVVHGMWQYHGLCVAQVCRELGVPYVIFLHGMLDPWFNRHYPLKRLKKWLYWPWAEYRVLRDARFVLFTTEEELRLARQSFWLYRARERLVGFGIEARPWPLGSAREHFLERYPSLRGKRLLLYLSRLHPKKGCDLLLRAFAQVAAHDPALHLVLAGPDDVGLKAELEAQAGSLGLQDRVSFPGMLSGRTKWGAYDAAELFVLPSHQENFGIVIAEALSSALPVLTTHQVNIWRTVAEAGAGLVREDNAAGTLALLEDWLALAPQDQATMRQQALRCFEAHFHIRKVIGNLELALLEASGADRPPAHTHVGRLWPTNAAKTQAN